MREILKTELMKVIVRDMETGLYLNGPATWGDTQDEAIEFENSIEALEFCITYKIHNVEILLLMGDPRKHAPLRLFPRDIGVPALVRRQEARPQLQAR